jgi:hypothetical protein
MLCDKRKFFSLIQKQRLMINFKSDKRINTSFQWENIFILKLSFFEKFFTQMKTCFREEMFCQNFSGKQFGK